MDNTLPSQQDNAYSVDWWCLRSVGQMTNQITLGGITISEILHIFPNIPGGMLILWKTAEKLRILPESFPIHISATMPKPSVTAEDFFEEFPSVFDNQVQVIVSEVFRIQLNDNAQPFCVQAPSAIFFAWGDKVLKMWRGSLRHN